MRDRRLFVPCLDGVRDRAPAASKRRQGRPGYGAGRASRISAAAQGCLEESARDLDAPRTRTCREPEFAICLIPLRDVAVHRALGAGGGWTIRQAPLCRERAARSGRTDNEARYARPPDALAADQSAL